MIPFDHALDNVDGAVSGARLPYVYELLSYLVKRSGCRHIIDVGCGAADKLTSPDENVEIVCLGAARMRESVARTLPTANFIEADLSLGMPQLNVPLRDAIIVCTDIECLPDPTTVIRDLARLAYECAYVLISTPDRARNDIVHQANVVDPVNWTAEEFKRQLVDCGFPEGFLIGYTADNESNLSKNTILVVAGRDATFVRPERIKSVAAIINVFNEEDILEQVVRYLHDQCVQVHIVDNWSTDGSYEIAETLVARGLCAKVIRFPAAPPTDYDWMGLLRHASEYGASLQADWIIHHDADEFRCAPWPSVTLTEAISFVDSLGYTAIDFTILNFRFTDSDEKRPFSPAARPFCEFGCHPGDFLQIKAWKNQGTSVDLASTGGHEAIFAGRRVFPLKFLTRHYPLRSTTQASTRVFRDRLPRFEREKRERGWHDHYDIFMTMGSVRSWRRRELMTFNSIIFTAEFLTERLSGIGIQTEKQTVPNVNTVVEWLKTFEMTSRRLQETSRRLQELELEIAAMRQSSSWKITAPFRDLKSRLTGAFSVVRPAL